MDTSNMADFETVFPGPHGGKLPAVWRDKDGVMHRAVGAQMISRNRDTFIMWTACQQKDVPGGKSWLKRPEDEITCEGCKQAERIWEEDETEQRRADSQFGVGA